jgi:hypothetical protein
MNRLLNDLGHKLRFYDIIYYTLKTIDNKNFYINNLLLFLINKTMIEIVNLENALLDSITNINKYKNI